MYEVAAQDTSANEQGDLVLRAFSLIERGPNLVVYLLDDLFKIRYNTLPTRAPSEGTNEGPGELLHRVSPPLPKIKVGLKSSAQSGASNRILRIAMRVRAQADCVHKIIRVLSVILHPES